MKNGRGRVGLALGSVNWEGEREHANYSTGGWSNISS